MDDSGITLALLFSAAHRLQLFPFSLVRSSDFALRGTSILYPVLKCRKFYPDASALYPRHPWLQSENSKNSKKGNFPSPIANWFIPHVAHLPAQNDIEPNETIAARKFASMPGGLAARIGSARKHTVKMDPVIATPATFREANAAMLNET